MTMPVTSQAGGPDRLLERSAQLAALREALQFVIRTSQGRLAMVSGEAGVGKTSLLQAFRGELSGTVRMLWGGCDPLFTPRPLGPLLALADAIEGELKDLIRSGVVPHEVVTAFARDFRGRPTVFVLEDAHWADEATLDVLRLLVRRIDTVPCLIIATFRDDELERKHPLRIMLGEFATNRSVDRLRLAALSREAVAGLASQHGVDPEELYRRTAGNPFFVVEVLAAPSLDVPETVRDAVLARSARLGSAAQLLLEAVSIVPPQAELWLLQGVASDSIAALDECLSSGMLVPAAAGAVGFRHELARLAINDSISPERMMDLHRKALAALADPPDGTPDYARLADHADAISDFDAIVRYAVPAAERASSSGAHREAVAQYARVLRFGARLSPMNRIDLLKGRAVECFLTDQYDDGIANLEDAVSTSRQLGDALQEGDCLRRLSEFLWCPGRVAESGRAALEAVRLLEQLPHELELGRAYSNLSFVYAQASRIPDAITLARQGVAIAERLGDTRTAIGASARIASCEGNVPLLKEVLKRARQADLEVEFVYMLLAESAIDRKALREAREYLDDGIAYCAARGIELARLYLLAYRAGHELLRGAWTEAVEAAGSVLRIPRTSTTPRILALVVLGLVRARRGDPGHDDALDEAWDLAWPTGELPRIAPVAAARAEVAWLNGDSSAVDRATKDALQLAIDRQAYRYAGELAVARQRASLDSGVAAEQVPAPYSLLLGGDSLAAARMWRELGCPYEAAMALLAAGDDASVRQALEELQRLDARPAAALAARRLREHGVRSIPRGPRASTLQNPANLTEREIEVLRLIVAGHRNSEIAARLVVSERTVDHHVSAILGKLGARTRVEASAHAARIGVIESSR